METEPRGSLPVIYEEEELLPEDNEDEERDTDDEDAISLHINSPDRFYLESYEPEDVPVDDEDHRRQQLHIQSASETLPDWYTPGTEEGIYREIRKEEIVIPFEQTQVKLTL